MKNLNLTFAVLLSTILFISCDKLENIFEEEGDSNNPQIEMNTQEVLFNTDGGNNTFSFTTNESWTAQVINSRADNWCSIEPTSGAAGNAKITVTTTANDTYDDRSASINIKSGSTTKTVTVSQKQKDALTVTSSKFEVAAEGGEVVIEVKANIDFEYAIDEAAKEWISCEGTRAMKTSKLAFKISENDTKEKREGKITVKNGEFKETITIYQEGLKPSIVISKSEYVVASAGETISVEVKSNVDVAIEFPADADWIKENTTRTTSTNTYRFDVDENVDYDQRSIEIKFANKENNLSEVVTVVQMQKDALVIAKDSYTVNSDGGQIQIEIGHNIDFDVEISVDWIIKTECTRAFTTETLNFIIAENTDYDKREGEIVFKSKDGKLSQIVKVYQTQEDLKIAYSTDMEELDDWTGGLFGGNGTYILGKPHGDNGFLMTIGNILEEESAIVFMDKNKQIREIYIDDLVFILVDNANGGVGISIIEKGCEIKTEHIILESRNYTTRSSRNHSQQVGIINLTMNLQGMYDAIMEIVNAKGFSKKGVIMFLANKTDAIRNTVKALGGPDIFNDTFSTWLGNGMNVVSLAELSALYGKAGTLGPAGACILAYAGLYTTYLELYDEHIELYFGRTQAEINNLTVKDYKRLDIDVEVTGYEPWYNIEYGVIVQENSFPAPRYSDGLVTKNVSQNGNYTFVKDDIQVNKTYYCRPFLIDKNRTSLWKGLIGDIVGPLVRYGEVKSVSVDILCSAITGDFITSTDNSAIVKCSYYNVNGLKNIECGVCVINTETGKIKEIPTNNADGEREINITSLTPATTYTYNAYIKINNIIVKEGCKKSFKTQPLETSHINSIQTISAYPYKSPASYYDYIQKIQFNIDVKGEVCNHNQQYYLYYIIDDEIVHGQPIYTDENGNTFAINKQFDFSKNDIEIDYSSYIAKKNIEIGICYMSDGEYVYLQPQSHILQYDETPKLEVVNFKNVEVSKHKIEWYHPTYYSYYEYHAVYSFDYRVSGSFWIFNIIYKLGYNTLGTEDGLSDVHRFWAYDTYNGNIFSDGTSSFNGNCTYDERKGVAGIGDIGIKHSDFLYAITIDGKEICRTEFSWGGSLDNPTVSKN